MLLRSKIIYIPFFPSGLGNTVLDITAISRLTKLTSLVLSPSSLHDPVRFCSSIVYRGQRIGEEPASLCIDKQPYTLDRRFHQWEQFPQTSWTRFDFSKYNHEHYPESQSLLLATKQPWVLDVGGTIGKCTNLKFLLVESCKKVGCLPEMLMTSCTNLEHLHIPSYDRLTTSATLFGFQSNGIGRLMNIGATLVSLDLMQTCLCVILYEPDATEFDEVTSALHILFEYGFKHKLRFIRLPDRVWHSWIDLSLITNDMPSSRRHVDNDNDDNDEDDDEDGDDGDSEDDDVDKKANRGRWHIHIGSSSELREHKAWFDWELPLKPWGNKVTKTVGARSRLQGNFHTFKFITHEA